MRERAHPGASRNRNADRTRKGQREGVGGRGVSAEARASRRESEIGEARQREDPAKRVARRARLSAGAGRTTSSVSAPPTGAARMGPSGLASSDELTSASIFSRTKNE